MSDSSLGHVQQRIVSSGMSHLVPYWATGESSIFRFEDCSSHFRRIRREGRGHTQVHGWSTLKGNVFVGDSAHIQFKKPLYGTLEKMRILPRCMINELA